ncbi:manganese efflux pump [Anaerotruncus massiliensis (ex Liu et al. 2021)]|uniref:manganese efflux pump n=1 Tax=Anaerotruncus massiliensis (ex Liu et al. 2021) TaxID=2321404 RepID=UPI003A8863F2
MLFVFVTALALSADGFAAGASFGLRGVKIGAAAKTAIALLSTGFAFAAVTAGGALGAFLPPSAGRWIGAGAAVRSLLPAREASPASEKPPLQKRFHALGLTILVVREPSAGDLDNSGSIDLGEALLLGFSLSVDMLGAGIGLALAGAGSLWLPLAVGVTQTACLALGEAVGKRLSRLPVPKRALGVLSGLLLAALGAARLVV